MSKPTAPPDYATAKLAFGGYIVQELRQLTHKDAPTEADVRKLLLRLRPGCSAADLQSAKQLSRYCRDDEPYLLKAREETLDRVAALLRLPIAGLGAFRQRLNPAFRTARHYVHYVAWAITYRQRFADTTEGRLFRELFRCDDATLFRLVMINYPFGEQNPALPASHFGAYTDIRTEVLLKELLAEQGFARIESTARFDATLFGTAGNVVAERETWIGIGLVGNALTGWLLAQPNVVGRLALDTAPTPNALRMAGHTYAPDRAAQTDFGLVLRYVVDEHRTVVILGGIEGFGTEQLGAYVRHDWPSVAQRLQTADALLYRITGRTVLPETSLRFSE